MKYLSEKARRVRQRDDTENAKCTARPNRFNMFCGDSRNIILHNKCSTARRCWQLQFMNKIEKFLPKKNWSSILTLGIEIQKRVGGQKGTKMVYRTTMITKPLQIWKWINSQWEFRILIQCIISFTKMTHSGPFINLFGDYIFHDWESTNLK